MRTSIIPIVLASSLLAASATADGDWRRTTGLDLLRECERKTAFCDGVLYGFLAAARIAAVRGEPLFCAPSHTKPEEFVTALRAWVWSHPDFAADRGIATLNVAFRNAWPCKEKTLLERLNETPVQAVAPPLGYTLDPPRRQPIPPPPEIDPPPAGD